MLPTWARNSDVANPSDLSSRLPRNLVRKEVEHHGRPAGVPAPAAAEEQRAEDLRHGIVDGRGLEGAGEQVVPEALDLHVLARDQAEVHEHVEPHEELRDPACVSVPLYEKADAEGDRRADVGEVEEVEEVALRQPERDRHGLEGREHRHRHYVLPHPAPPPLDEAKSIAALAGIIHNRLARKPRRRRPSGHGSESRLYLRPHRQASIRPWEKPAVD